MSNTDEQDPAWLSTLITDSPSTGQMVKGYLNHEIKWRDEKIERALEVIATDILTIETQKRLMAKVGNLNLSLQKELENYKETIADLKLVLKQHDLVGQSLERANDQEQGSDATAR
jgi:hypothetical protein